MHRLVRRAVGLLVLAALTVLATVLATTSGASAATRPELAWGAYVGTDAPAALDRFEQTLGTRVAIASSFRGWGDIFPDAVQQEQAADGHTLLIAWDLGDTADTRFSTFYNGDHDAYLAAEATAAKDFGATVYVRPWAEMNADWVPFQPTASGSKAAGGTYAQFIRAWRYVVTFFRSHGATNVRWVFNPTTDTYAETTQVNKIWPGARYVDVLGLDGYNWGTGGVLKWRSFADIYRTQYRRLTALAPTLPVWVCEFGSKAANESDGAAPDPRHSKSGWLSGMFSWLSGADHVQALVMFNVRKERDWRVQSSPAALHVMRLQARSAAPRVATS
jgi:mannan endo-1,4-beta-mannosidase